MALLQVLKQFVYLNVKIISSFMTMNTCVFITRNSALVLYGDVITVFIMDDITMC
jgi:hypothetical protein